MRRRVVFAVVIAALLFCCVAAGGCDNNGGKTMWFETPTVKVLSDRKPGKDAQYTVYIAGNEKEGCQAVFRYDHETGPLKIEVKEPENEDGVKLGVELFKEEYVTTTYAEPFCADEKLIGQTVMYPDGLRPFDGELPVNANESTPLYILFDSKDAPAGEYRTEVVAYANGEVIDRGEITVRVWNFSMPEGRTMSAVSDLGVYSIQKAEGVQGQELTELYLKYYEFMLEHNVTPYSLPYDILDDRADAYMDDPRVTRFRVPYSSDDNVITAYYEKLSTKQKWLEKAYFYPLDEPGDTAAFGQVNAAAERLKKLFPEYNMVVPFFMDPDIKAGVDAIDYVSDDLNIWCPKLYCFDSENIYSAEQLISKAPFADRMKSMRSRGDDLWWYVCWEPGDPYANLYVNMPGVKHRSIFWQAEQYGVNGFLYWSSNYWEQISDPWQDANTVKWLSSYVYGDGSLLYSGKQVGTDGPCSSLRLEAVRDGIDDYELIRIAEEAGVREKQIRSILNKVARSITDYSTNDLDIYNARKELGRLIEEALGSI
ncbi:MAG: DUF4091 domain-containing protein [Clostridia bacterium]|nr:DUF4091 domain-containing protein [Clostridia bacterium]